MNKNTNMNNNTLMHKLSLSALLALLVLSLSACAEQLLEAAAEDPKPGVTPGEADYVTSQVMAQNSADDERSPQANDITLGSYNNSDTNTSNDVIGQSNLMPIRIPFSGAITDLYNSDGSLNDDAASAYISNIAIIELPTIALASTLADAIIIPLPANDRAGNSVSVTIGGNTVPGTFKAVYQDSNHDLVLVPGADTFKPSTDTASYSYFVLVHKDLNGADGQNIIPDTLTKLLTTDQKLIDDANTTIYSAILEDINDNNISNDENDTASVASLEAARQTYVGVNGDGVGDIVMLGYTQDPGLDSFGFNFTSASDIAGVFHFTTNTGNAAAVGAIDSMFDTAKTSDINEDLVWLDVTLAGIINDEADLNDQANLKGTIEALLDTTFSSVDFIYKGFFTCTNFLENEGNDTTISADGADSDRWDLNDFAKLDSPTADCPNSISGLEGKIGFWVTAPTTSSGVVVFQHGIGGYKDFVFRIANTLAGYGYTTVAIDIWGHGERTYEDGDNNGVIDNTIDTNYSDSGAFFIRPDDPPLSAGYYLQTLIDIYRLSAFITDSNSELNKVLGDLDATTTPVHFVGMSLGGIMGASLASMSSVTSTDKFVDPFANNKYVLNVTGADIADIILSGYFGTSIRNSVADSRGYDTSTVFGQQELNSAMVAVDLLTSNTLFSYSADPLSTITDTLPLNVLVQEMQGDIVVPNNTTEIMAQAMNLANYYDGNSSINTTTGDKRIRWRLDPDNYSKDKDGNDAGHGFLLDNDTNATAQGQLQVACYLAFGYVLNPAASISLSCSN